MSRPTSMVWKLDPHTEAKHQLLRWYMDAWWPIILQRPGTTTVTYVDGFAGPGEYEGGEMGSPLIALRSVLSRPHLLKLGATINFLFIEEDDGRANHLEQLIAERFPQIDRFENIQAKVVPGVFAEEALKRLNEIGALGHPLFANLDTWGVGDIPFDVVKSIAGNPSSEVLVTFMTDFFKRFGKSEGAKFAIKRMFGPTELVPDDLWEGEDVPSTWVRQYSHALEQAGFAYSMQFRLADEGSHRLDLVYGTNHPRGVERMKDAMWKVDPVLGTSFRDPKDPNQLALGFLDPDLKPLKFYVLPGTLHVQGAQTVQQLWDRYFLSVYKKTHITSALRQLRDEGVVVQKPPRGRLVASSTVELAPGVDIGELLGT